MPRTIPVKSEARECPLRPCLEPYELLTSLPSNPLSISSVQVDFLEIIRRIEAAIYYKAPDLPIVGIILTLKCEGSKRTKGLKAVLKAYFWCFNVLKRRTLIWSYGIRIIQSLFSLSLVLYRRC